jgi:hypothetical protein
LMIGGSEFADGIARLLVNDRMEIVPDPLA